MVKVMATISSGFSTVFEQRDVAPHQELGLARAGGRLDDERAPRVERGGAGSLVGDGGH